MLRQVEAISDMGDSLSLQLGETSSGIILTGIDGLDPVQASIAASSFAQQDGQRYHSARRESRNIVLGMNLDSRFAGHNSNRPLRQQLYSVFSPKRKVKLQFEFDDLTVETEGVVENIDAPMFMDKPKAIVSIICPDPDLIDPTYRESSGEAYAHTVSYRDVDYQGDVETGFRLRASMNASDSATGFTIYQILPSGEEQTLEFVAPIEGSDQIEIVTIPGEKLAQRTRSGSTTSILHGVSPSAQWLKLRPGMNQIGVRATGSTFSFYWELDYRHRYGGL